MCGIAGFVSNEYQKTDLQKMGNKISHRGPDSGGEFLNIPVGLVHKRLSVLDLSDSANQPYFFDKLVLIFNGEIYNYKELRQLLVKKGYQFDSNSDTEVVIKAFHYWREKSVEHFIGMFAFALYDLNDQNLFLFRDRIGVKPIYFYSHNKQFIFASELKAIKSIIPLDVSSQGVNDYLRFGYTIGANTIYKNVYKLEPGHFLKYKIFNQSLTKTCYWSPENFLLDPFEIKSEEKHADELEELLVSSFKYRMVSDVPIGIFFSGGIDSSLVSTLLSKHFGQINTFTIGFESDTTRFNEAKYANKIAHYLGTNHTEKILTMREAKVRLDDFYNIYDEPFSDASGIPTSLVSELAKSKGMKVVLSSDGGDELFGGYPRYKQLEKIGRNLVNVPIGLKNLAHSTLLPLANISSELAYGNFGNRISKILENIGTDDWQAFYEANIVAISKSQMDKYTFRNSNNLPLFHADIKNIHPIKQFMLWDLKYYLPDDLLVKIDRATMYHGLEGREPFLDHRLVEFALRTPVKLLMKDGIEKYLLKKILTRHLPNKLFDRPKQGFSIPMFEWFKKDFDNMIISKLNINSFGKYQQIINYEYIKKEMKLYMHSKSVNKEYNITMIWRLLSFALWGEKWNKNYKTNK